MNPYSGTSFFEFFIILGKRIITFLSGQNTHMVSDEIQLVVLIFCSMSAAIVGTFLILRKMTMLANSLSHTVLLGIFVAYFVSQKLFMQNSTIHTLSTTFLILGAFISAILTTFATEFLHKKLGLQKDASIGLIFTSLFALAIICISSMARNTHVDINIISGNIDVLHVDGIKQVFFLFLFNVSVMLLMFRYYEFGAFDHCLSMNLGIPVLGLNYFLMFQTALTAIFSFKAVGTFLFLALLVTPGLIARFFCIRLKMTLFISCLIGAFSSLVAVALSRHILSVYRLPLATSGILVVVLMVMFLGSVSWKLRWNQ